MEFLVEFDVQVPAGTPQSEVRDRERAESAAAAKLADEGHLVRLWRRPRAGDGPTAVGLYRADSEAHLEALLSDLPLADWQIVLADGTALADVRYTLQTDAGALLYVQSRGVRHGPAEVLARLGRGEEVDAGEYTFRTATRIQTAASEFDWLNNGVFISVGGRRPGGVIYETYLVG